MSMQVNKNAFNLAKNCVNPLLSNTVNRKQKSELSQIKAVTERYDSFISFKACSTQGVQDDFFKLVEKYEDDLSLSFVC